MKKTSNISIFPSKMYPLKWYHGQWKIGEEFSPLQYGSTVLMIIFRFHQTGGNVGNSAPVRLETFNDTYCRTITVQSVCNNCRRMQPATANFCESNARKHHSETVEITREIEIYRLNHGRCGSLRTRCPEVVIPLPFHRPK